MGALVYIKVVNVLVLCLMPCCIDMFNESVFLISSEVCGARQNANQLTNTAKPKEVEFSNTKLVCILSVCSRHRGKDRQRRAGFVHCSYKFITP